MDKLVLKLSALFALLASFGCDPFDPGSLISDTRVLGARVEVDGDEERASPRPGEIANVTWVVVSPEGTPSLRWAFVACPAGEAGEACATSPLSFVEGAGAVPTLRLAIPGGDALGDADRITVLGVICDRGTPALDPRGTPTCEGDAAEGTPVTLDVHLARKETDLNLNPSLDAARISVAGDEWTPDTADVAMGSCSRGDGLPIIEAGSPSRDVVLALGRRARERIVENGAPSFETLQISHFVTGGELATQYSFVEPSDARERPSLSFEWEPPAAEDVPEGGEVVRLVVVVRDLRGGVAVTERALCVVR